MAGHHDHGHSHGHGHSHAPFQAGRAFAIGIAANLVFVGVEAGYGIAAGSIALVADAGHNLSDVLGLAVAWFATWLAKRPASDRFTYGLRSSSILAALANALLIFAALGVIAWEAVQRIAAPEPVAGVTVMIVAGIGILVNGATALLFARGRAGDLNIRAAFAHMVTDAVVSAGVVISGLLTLLTGLGWIDPVTSLIVVAVVVAGSWGLLRDSMGMALQGVPSGIAVDEVTAHLRALPGVAGVHHLHIWPVSTSDTALTGHLLMPGGHPGDAFLNDAAHGLKHDFGIGHATLQIEVDPGSCRDC